jgi:hypothetical protein
MKTLAQIQVDQAAQLNFQEGKLGLTISPSTGAYQILVQDESLVAQFLNHQGVNGSISNIEVEVEHDTPSGLITLRPMPAGQFTTATLILFPQRAWVKRYF